MLQSGESIFRNIESYAHVAVSEIEYPPFLICGVCIQILQQGNNEHSAMPLPEPTSSLIDLFADEEAYPNVLPFLLHINRSIYC